MISEEYAEMASLLIDEDEDLSYLKDFPVTIIYLKSDKEKKSGGKVVKGECEKVSDKNKWAIPADFCIIIYENNCAGMSDDQMKILMKHELLHIKVDEDGNYKIRKHDLEDFRCITRRYGADWSTPGYSVKPLDDEEAETY